MEETLKLCKRKIIKLGKIDYCGIGRKTCPVEITVELRPRGDNGPELSICGDIWNHKHTNCYCAGQCLDTIGEFIDTPEFTEIKRLWHLYHLNGMHAGTIAQEEALAKAGKTAWAKDYTECCKYLESIGLLVDNGYKFGTGWLYRAIPEEDLEKIKALLK